MRGTHIMTDIETLGTSEGSTIFQIAAAAFNMQTGDILGEINLKLDIAKADLKVDGSTLKWWLNTDKELLTNLLNEGDLSEDEMLIQFDKWVRQFENRRLWGNGILFDNAKLKKAMESIGMEYPIRYNKDRDVRTILALASDITGKSEKEIKKEVEDINHRAHNAIDDVHKQINFVRHCYKLLSAASTVE